MSKHGYLNRQGVWVEEPCNAYCRGDQHATVMYLEKWHQPEDLLGRHRIDSSLVVLEVREAGEAAPCSTDRLVGASVTSDDLIGVLAIFRREDER